MSAKISRLGRLLCAAVVCVSAVSAASSAAADQLVALSRGERALYAVDTENLGSPVKIGDISVGSDLNALAFSPEGTLITTDRTANTLITLDAGDASVQSVVALARDLPIRPRGFDFDGSGVLYGVFGGMELATINRTTGACTTMATLTGAAHVEGLAFATDGTLFAVGSAVNDATAEELYEVNIATGVLSLIGHTGR